MAITRTSGKGTFIQGETKFSHQSIVEISDAETGISPANNIAVDVLPACIARTSAAMVYAHAE